MSRNRSGLPLQPSAKSPERWRRERTLYPFFILAMGIVLVWCVHGTTLNFESAQSEIATGIGRMMGGQGTSEKFQ